MLLPCSINSFGCSGIYQPFTITKQNKYGRYVMCRVPGRRLGSQYICMVHVFGLIRLSFHVCDSLIIARGSPTFRFFILVSSSNPILSKKDWTCFLFQISNVPLIHYLYSLQSRCHLIYNIVTIWAHYVFLNI